MPSSWGESWGEGWGGSWGPLSEPLSGYSLEIAGTERKALLFSFRVELVLNGIDTGIAVITSDDESPEIRFELDDEVILRQDGERLFGGFVTHVDEDGEGGPNTGRFLSRLTISGYGEILQRRHITIAADLGSPGSPGPGLDDFLQHLVTTYWASEGITLHPAQSASAVMKEVEFEDALGTEILNRIATDNGLMWRVDEQKRLRMWAKGDIAAPYDIDVTEDPPKYFGDIRTSKSRYHGYANRVIVKGTPQTILLFSETVTSTGVETTFQATHTMLGTHAGAVAVTNVPSMGVADGQTLFESMRRPGQPYDTIWELDTTTGTYTRLDGPLPSGAVIRLEYDAFIQARGEANDLADQALYPVRDEIIQAPVTNDADAQDLAEQILPSLVAAKNTTAKFRTFETGLIYPGHTIGIEASDRNLSGDFLVTRVVICNWQNYESLIREVDTTQGDVPRGDWRDLINQFASGVAPGNVSNSNNGGNNNGGNGGSVVTNPDGDGGGGAGSNLAIPPHDTDIIFNKHGALGTHHSDGSPMEHHAQILYQRDADIIAGGSPGSAEIMQMVLTSIGSEPEDSVLVLKNPDGNAMISDYVSPAYVTRLHGAEYAENGWVARSTSVSEIYHTNDGGFPTDSGICEFALLLFNDQTPGSPMTRADLTREIGTYWQANGRMYLWNAALGASRPGRMLLIEANTSSGGAPGCISLEDKNRAKYYLWVDTTGDLRIGTDPPQADGTPSDTSGTVVGTQS